MVKCSQCNYFEPSGYDKNHGNCASPGIMIHRVANPYRDRKCKRFALTQARLCP